MRQHDNTNDCAQCGHSNDVHDGDALACLVCTCPSFLPDSGLQAGLWSIEQVADYWDVSPSRARAILAQAGVTSGYDPDTVKAIPRNPGQGARTDLKKGSQDG